MARPARLLLCALLCFLMPALAVRAQTAPAQTAPAAKPSPATEKSRSKSNANGAADPLAEVRRTTAVSLVIALADDARQFRDTVLAARVQARAADALWDADNERARALFRRAWDAADAADRESLRKQEEEQRAQQANGGAYARINPPNLRAEVLRLSARRDRALGEEFLAKLDEAKKQDDESAKAQADSAFNRLEPSQALKQRLELAQSLVAGDEIERALQFADPALRNVTVPAISFLTRLREKDAKAADERYAALLARAAADPSTDANIISILSSYVFTPNLYITVDPEGGISSSRYNRDSGSVDVAPALRKAFLNTAAQVLLRPLPQTEQDSSTSGRTGLYFMITRLLPLFDQYLPERSAALRAQAAALAQNVSEDLRSGKNDALREGLTPDEESSGSTNAVQDALDRAERETNPAKRNQAYAQAALAAAARGDIRARDYADKIDDTELRKAARSFADYELVNAALNKKDAALAARMTRTGELTSLQRVWAYTESAALLYKTDAPRATELLEEAATEASHIGVSDADHARAVVAVATGMFQLNHQRGWEMMEEAVKASNSAQGFTGEDGRVQARFMTQNSVSMSSSTVDQFDLAGIFTLLARDDFNRAVELIKGFNTEAPRAAATLAVARAILTEKKK